MSYLHLSPVQYHGNLKSSNVLLDSRWTCKVSDFGLKEFRLGEGGPMRGEPSYYYGNYMAACIAQWWSTCLETKGHGFDFR
jgi:serine/threonine protein kinase